MTDSTAIFYGLMGAGSALIFSCAGAAFGSAKSQQQCKIAPAKMSDGYTATETNNPPPTITGKTLIPVIIAGVLAIYGLIYSVIVLSSVSDPSYTLSQGYAQFVGGLCCLGSGIAVGVVGKIGIHGMAQNTSSFTMMVLNLIYCEALGLYGLIFGLIASSTF